MVEDILNGLASKWADTSTFIKEKEMGTIILHEEVIWLLRRSFSEYKLRKKLVVCQSTLVKKLAMM